MVSLRLTKPIDRFTTWGMKHVQLASSSHRTQIPVDRRQRDGAPLRTDLLMQLLSGSETPCVPQGIDDCRSLLRATRCHSNISIAAITPTPHPNASSCITDLTGSGSLWISGIRSVLAI